MSRENLLHRIPLPPVLFLSCIIASSLLHRTWPAEIASYSFDTGMAAGGAALCVAGAIGGSAIALLLKHRTPIEPGYEPRHLVISGPFRMTRNPMYLTLVLVHTALAVMVNSLWMAGGAALLFVLLDRLVIVKEELMIGAAFGSEYQEFKRRVRRWL